MCVFIRMGEYIATLDSMSHRSILYENVNMIQAYLFMSVIILLKESGIHMLKKKNCKQPTQRNTS